MILREVAEAEKVLTALENAKNGLESSFQAILLAECLGSYGIRAKCSRMKELKKIGDTEEEMVWQEALKAHLAPPSVSLIFGELMCWQEVVKANLLFVSKEVLIHIMSL